MRPQPPAAFHYPREDHDLRLLTLSWYRRARLAQLAHAAAASRARRHEVWLGVPVVVLSATVGSAIFATIKGNPGEGWQTAAGLLSLAAGVLAALQTFLRLGEQSREHESASRAFGALRRELGQLGAVAGASRESVEARLEHIRAVYDQSSATTRNVPDRVYRDLRPAADKYWPPEFMSWPERPGDDHLGSGVADPS